MDYTIQCIVMGVCFIIGLFFIVTNWCIFWRGWIKKRPPYVSPNPFIGGIFTAIGILLIPCNEMWYLCFIPLFADLGCIPLII